MEHQVGPYRVLDELARGGMGVVYRARGPEGLVALKLVLDPAQLDPRFEREVEAHRGLDHPAIVRVYGSGRDARGRPFLALELVAGESLAQRLKRDGPWSSARVVTLGLALSDALAYAHRQGVLHRDLKPGNVLLDHDDHPKLSDFGLARIEDQRESLTRTGTLLGTPAYMSPEQASGEKGLMAPTTDVYGLGALLYDMVCGRPPFEGESVLNILTHLFKTDPVPPSRHTPGVDAGLERVILRCLAKSPVDRYATMEELHAALANLAPGRRAAAPWVALGLVSLGIAAAVGVVLTAPRAPEPAADAPATQTPSPTSRPDPAPLLADLLEAFDAVYRGEIPHGGEAERAVLDRVYAASLQAPPTGEWRLIHGLLKQRNDAYEEAVELFEAAVSAEPERALTWRLLAEARLLLALNGATDPVLLSAAEEAARQALRLDPADALARLVLGRVYGQRAEWQPALRELEAVVAARPRWWLARCERATYLLAGEGTPSQTQLATAREELQAVLDQLPDGNLVRARPLLQLAQLERTALRPHVALPLLDELAEQHPEQWLGRIVRTEVLVETGAPQRAFQACEALDAEPDLPPYMRSFLYYRWASYLLGTGDTEGASTMLARTDSLPMSDGVRQEVLSLRQMLDRLR